MTTVLQFIEKIIPAEKDNLVSIFDFDLVESYYFFLDKFNYEGGFFSKKDSDLIIPRHIIESLIYTSKVTKLLSVSRETTLCDVGSGPGLPGILFLFLRDPPQITLLDSQKRKLSILEREISKWILTREIKFVYDRVEDHKQKYDVVVMRSTIPYPWSIELVSHIVKPNGIFLPFLGRETSHLEIEQKILSQMNFLKEKEIFLPELNFLGERRVKVLKKQINTNFNRARLWKDIQKEIRQHNG